MQSISKQEVGRQKKKDKAVAKNIVITSFSISVENEQKLTSLAKELQISKSSILNDLLNKHLQTPKNLTKLPIHAKTKEETHKTIKLAFTKIQYEFLHAAAKNSLINSVPKLIKFHTLNMMYDSKILNYKEIEALALTRAEIHKIGVNINQIARVLNTQNEANIDLRLQKELEKLKEAITQISDDIKALCSSSQGLFA